MQIKKLFFYVISVLKALAGPVALYYWIWAALHVSDPALFNRNGAWLAGILTTGMLLFGCLASFVGVIDLYFGERTDIIWLRTKKAAQPEESGRWAR